MSLPYRPLFRYGENLSLALELPITPWVRHTAVVGGDIEADSGARAAYVVRRDEFLTFTLRFFEEEWPFVQFFLDYGQTGQLLVWYPDRDDLSVQFTCYLELPDVGSNYQPIPDGEYPRAFMLEITLVRGTWLLPPWNNPDDVPPPAGPTGWVIHTFIYNTIFAVLAGSGNAEILIVGGGGSGGSVDGTGVGAGGGGAGGVRHTLAFPLSPGSYDVYPGAGATANHADHMIGIGSAGGNTGGDSYFGANYAHGGGGGGPSSGSSHGGDGASGGGGASSYNPFTHPPDYFDGGAAIWPLEMGHAGGAGANSDADSLAGAGGGGATGPGSLGSAGTGYLSDIASVDGTMYEYARGGPAIAGPPSATGKYGHGGGGGSGPFCDGGIGGYGVIIVKYRLETGIVATGGIRVEYPDP